MTTRRFHWLALVPFVVIACGGGTKNTNAPTGDDADAATTDSGPASGDDGSSPDGSAPPTGSNVVPIVVNAGPPGVGSNDVPFISITLCVPGTSNCQTIDYISVDTGSSGLRVIASALPSGFTLPAVTTSGGAPMAECFTFGDGFVWGAVRDADLKIGGEVAANIPLQIIADPSAGSPTSDCLATGSAEDTVATFGGNGIIGINQIVADCGSYCSDSAGSAGYYGCTGGACTSVAVPEANQVSNPIASFAADNNGAVITFPAVPDEGATTLTGSLVFGVGTQSNNALGSATVQTVDDVGNFTTVFNGQTLNESYIDSGTSLLSFNDTAIAQCNSGDLAGSGYYCPASPVMLMGQNKGLNGVTTTVSFTVESAQTLFDNASYTAFSDLAGTGSDGTFAWGFPFFIGRTVFVALQGASTSGGNGPYYAY